MSAGRYEIFDDGPCIRIVSPDSTISTIVGRPVGYHIDDAVIGAIRQQARDIAELEVFAEIGRQWNADSSLAKWFPLTAERVDQDAQEIAKLRTDLAAAVAERDGIAIERDQARLTLREIAQILIEQIGSVGPENAINAALRACGVIESMATRLAAIDAAPVVAWQDVHDPGDLYWRRPDPAQVDTRELIARPAKD